MAAIQDALNTLATQTDLFAVVLPFVLVFALTYGLLMKVDLFDGKSEPINAVIAVAIGLYVAANPVVTGMSSQLSSAFGAVGITLVIVLTGLVGAALMGVKPGEGSGRIWGGLGAALAVGLIGLTAVYFELYTAVFPNGVPGTGVALPGMPGIDLLTAGVALVAIGGVAYPIAASTQSSGE